MIHIWIKLVISHPYLSTTSRYLDKMSNLGVWPCRIWHFKSSIWVFGPLRFDILKLQLGSFFPSIIVFQNICAVGGVATCFNKFILKGLSSVAFAVGEIHEIGLKWQSFLLSTAYCASSTWIFIWVNVDALFCRWTLKETCLLCCQ